MTIFQRWLISRSDIRFTTILRIRLGYCNRNRLQNFFEVIVIVFVFTEFEKKGNRSQK